MNDKPKLYVFYFKPATADWVVREYYSQEHWSTHPCKEKAAYTAKLLNSAIKETELVFGMAFAKLKGMSA
jgi:hypothetical protein